jgi:RNA polymerase sigma-70 factor, ECF subfamily
MSVQGRSHHAAESLPGDRPACEGRTDWARLFEERAGQLAAIALLHARDAAEAEDLLQDALCGAIAGRVVPDDPIAYLAAAIRHAAIDRHRRCGVARRAIEAFVEIDAAAARADDDRPEAQRLLTALLDLPDPQREVLLLRTRGGLTFAQIAAVLEQSPNTVASHHRRGLATLRTLLAGDVP